MIILRKALSTSLYLMVDKILQILAHLKTEINSSPCLLCGDRHQEQQDICQACLSDLPHNKQACVRCALPINAARASGNEDIVCGNCIKQEPPFQECHAPMLYDFPIDSCLRLFKYRGKRYFAKPFAMLITRHIENKYESDDLPDVLMPVPLHLKRHFDRGFNQSEALANIISKQLGLNIDTCVLSKIAETDTQASLDKKQRKQNLKNAFRVSSHTYKHIVLIDDVMTTGATTEVLAQHLLDKGAERVDVWCVARTPKQH